jgi:hypothetical protein
MKSWLKVEKFYGSDGIMTFAGTYVVPSENKQVKQPLQQTTKETLSSPIQGPITGTGTDI